MENASKALLIAGAILICILLIGVGMLIYNGAINNIDDGIASMDENAKQAFNIKFTQYEGKKSGSNVRELVIEEASFKPTTSDLKMNEMSAKKATINTGAYYNVTIEYNTKSGLVNKVVVKKAS